MKRQRWDSRFAARWAGDEQNVVLANVVRRIWYSAVTSKISHHRRRMSDLPQLGNGRAGPVSGWPSVS